MSRAFVREPDSDLPESMPDRPLSRHPNLVTKTGLDKIELRLRELEQARTEAQSRVDTSALAGVERDLRYWRQRRSSARLIEPDPSPYVARFGVTVRLRLADASERSYRIVGEDEADPAAGLISWVSPVGGALIGHRLGDQLELPDSHAEIIGLSADPTS